MNGDKRQFDVLALGEPMVEFNQRDAGQPNYLQGFGGDTSNAAIAASRQGARCAYATAVGDDAFGRALLALWHAEGVNTTAVQVDAQAHTGVYFVSHGPAGHEFSYLRAGSAASRMVPGNWLDAAIRASRWLHVSAISQAISSSACDTVFDAIERASAAGTRISYDPNLRLRLWPAARARAVILATLPMCDLFLPSLDEARWLCAGAPDAAAQPASLIDPLFTLGARSVVLKCGADGAWFAPAPGAAPQHVPAHAVQARDATGAGDCFDGSLLARLAAGDALDDAVRYASVAAALSTRAPGAVAPIPRRDEVLAAMKANRAAG
jgi:2-dehydro-3-deoxygluconokinase